MSLEYAPYIIIPIIIGYIIERYKDMSTLNSGLLVFFTFFFVKIVLILLYGGAFINDVSEGIILGSIIVLCMLLFHFQKWLRKPKNNI